MKKGSDFKAPASHKDIKPAKRTAKAKGGDYTGMDRNGGNGSCYTGMGGGCSHGGGKKEPSGMRHKR